MATSDFLVDLDWFNLDPRYFWRVADNTLQQRFQQDLAIAADGTNANNNTTRATALDSDMTGSAQYAITRVAALESRRIRELLERSVALEEESVALMTRLCGKLRAL